MKHTLTLLLLSSITISSFSQNNFKEAFLTRWDNMESYTLEMLDAIPDSLMDYRPVDSVFTVRQQFVHLVNHLQWIGTTYLDTTAHRLDMEGWEEWPKTTIYDNLEASFQSIARQTESLTEPALAVTSHFRPAKRELSRYELLYLLLDHTRNHTGQLVVYLRLNGLAPPRYVGW